MFRAITALFSGIALGLVVTWFFIQFGALTGVVVLASALASQWLTVFGGKMFWSLWAFFVPLLVTMFYIRGKRRLDRPILIRLGGFVFAGMLVKTLFTGYEFITTAVVMTFVPLVFYGVRYGWSGAARRGAAFATGGAITLAIGASLGLLILQIASAQGTLLAGFHHVTDALLKRTYADPAAYPPGMGLESSPMDVLLVYLKGVWLDLNRFLDAPNEFVSWYLFRIRFAQLIAAFGLATLLLIGIGIRDAAEKRVSLGLVAATWFSLLAPLSWFVIFKAHSHIHVGMNQIAWHMPFVLFGFAIVGRLGGSMGMAFRRRHLRRTLTGPARKEGAADRRSGQSP